MPEFELWSEGYVATGGSAEAVFHGVFYADTFADACLKFKDKLPPKGKKYFNDEKLTFFGCRLFDNESDARKSFG